MIGYDAQSFTRSAKPGWAPKPPACLICSRCNSGKEPVPTEGMVRSVGLLHVFGLHIERDVDSDAANFASSRTFIRSELTNNGG